MTESIFGKTNEPLLALIDGSSLAYRAFFAFQKNPLRNSKGENTSAVFAFTNSVLKLLREYKPEYGAVVFDTKGPTFRHKLFEKYKATRPKAPDELTRQILYIKEVAKGLGFPVIEFQGFEADDIMATLAKMAKKKGIRVLLLTSDKDLLQLVDEKVHVLDTRPKTDVYYTPDTVVEKRGVTPDKVPDLLALEGDQIDNIPGVHGIGPKTAKMLINEFGSVENLLQNVDKIQRKSLRTLLSNPQIQEQILQSKSLAILEDNVPLDIDLTDLRLKEIDREKLFPIFKEMEFASLMAMLASEPKDIKESPLPPELPEEISVGMRDDLLAVGMDGNSYSLVSRDIFKNLLESKDLKKSTFCSKTLHKWALSNDVNIQNVEFDLRLASYLNDPGKPRYDLEYIAMETLGWHISENTRKQLGQEVTLVNRVKTDYEASLLSKKLMYLYREVELPLSQVLARMESRGIMISIEGLNEFEKFIQNRISKIISEIFEIAGTEFNLNSPNQLAYILFEKIGLKPRKRTKTGYSTDQDTLIKLAKEHPLPAKILEYRELYKLLSTYIQPLVSKVRNGRIYPTFDQTGTATGRLSCRDPNLQNIPIRTEIGRRMRSVFIAPEGFVLMSADYSQIELRILAHISGDMNLREAFMTGRDIHAETAIKIFGNESERRRAKIVNYGIAYGMSPYGLAKELSIPKEEAQRIIDGYFRNFPEVKQWINETLYEARKTGVVRTLLGRIRYVPEVNNPNRMVREMAERIAINTPIQGSAADLIKMAMVKIDRRFRERNLKSGLLLQIHDELLFEVAEEEEDEVWHIVKHEMENALPLSVPIEVEIGIGKTWLEAHS